MNEQSIDIERVVREVLAELDSRGAVALRTASGANVSGTLRVPPEKDGKRTELLETNGTRSVASERDGTRRVPDTAANGDLTIDARVLAMDDILGRLGAVRRIRVSKQAIVTPAVQDELLRRGIDLVRADSCNGKAVAAPRVTMVCSGGDFDPQPLLAALARDGVKAEQSECDCLIAATEKLAAKLAGQNTLGVLLTVHTAAGLCLANRRRGLRAVTAVDVPAVATAAAAVGANLLVVNPCVGSFFQVKQIISEFCRGGARPCPEVFREQLN
jgi:hypothetical protein